MNLRGDFFYYNVGEGQLMPFRPNFQLKFNSDYWVADKIKIGLSAIMLGKNEYFKQHYLKTDLIFSYNLGESIPPNL